MDASLREGIRLFNAREFFASHERLEEAYARAEERDKPFLEAIIELAVALRIFCDLEETAGPVRMIHQALIRLENYQPAYLRVKVKPLIGAMEEWAAAAKRSGPAEAARLRERIPKIGLRLLP